ncbi:MAG TPA: hypothetical protein VGN72_07655 [Tepidisphaeraceae bacterium]|jgi:hypothetical protein|nr:hypothetical protein [Tepidisphaeraceae bacterium]
MNLSLPLTHRLKFEAQAATLGIKPSELLRRWIDEHDRSERLTRSGTAGPESFRGSNPLPFT